MAEFVQNHQVSAEVLNAAQSDPKSLADGVALALVRNNITVKGCQLRTGLEVSPARRSILKAWYNGRDTIKALNMQKTFTYCERGMEVRDASETVRSGWMDRKEGEL